MTARRYLVSRGDGNRFVTCTAPADLADALEEGGRMSEAEAAKLAHRAWDEGRAEWGLMCVERREG